MASQEDLILLTRDDQTHAKIHLHGATLISWNCKDEERIFVSSQSLFDNKKAIRGGIPIVFPCFGPWEHGPQHGFARISRWELEQAPTKNSIGDVEVKLALRDSEVTRAMWDYKFKLIYKVTLQKYSVITELKIENTGSAAFSFTCLLHTYIRVPDISKVTVSGLKGVTYIDKVKGGGNQEEKNDVMQISENIDRIYLNTGSSCAITNAAGGNTLTVAKNKFPETVLWNPWEEKAKAMSDFGDSDYLHMLCVEPGLVEKATKLSPGDSFTASQTLMV